MPTNLCGLEGCSLYRVVGIERAMSSHLRITKKKEQIQKATQSLGRACLIICNINVFKWPCSSTTASFALDKHRKCIVDGNFPASKTFRRLKLSILFPEHFFRLHTITAKRTIKEPRATSRAGIETISLYSTPSMIIYVELRKTKNYKKKTQQIIVH